MEVIQGQEIDGVGIAVAYFLTPETGDGDIAEAVDTAAREDGVTPAVAVGNYANSHWQGEFSDPDGNGIHNFSGADETNSLNGGRTLSAGDRVEVYLKWDDWMTTDQDYDLFLVDGDGTVVAQSTRTQDGDDRPTEKILTNVSKTDTYHVVVEAADADGSHTLEMYFDGDASGEYTTAASSIPAPATADRAIGVGAYDLESGDPSGFSSVGPTNDGRRGVDVVAPSGVTVSAYDHPFRGTSPAAAHVAGLITLMRSADQSLSVSEIESILQNTAHDIGPSGVDSKTGYGRVDAAEAMDQIVDLDSDPPTINTFDLSASGTTLTTIIDASEALRNVTVEITDDAGNTIATLNRSDFTDTGSTTYEASISATFGVTYTADLQGVTDSVGNDATPNVTARATPGNTAPRATNDTYTTSRNTSLSVTPPGVLGNDTDPDGDGLSATLVGAPSNGTVTLQADGSFTYAPDSGFLGTETFTYEVADGEGGTDQATVSIEVRSELLTQKWSYSADSRFQYASPALNASHVFLGGLGADIVAVDRSTGNETWRFTREGSLVDSSPVVEDGRVIVGSGSGRLYAIATATGSEAWQYRTDSAIVSSPVVAGQTVYVGSNDGTVLAVNASDGSRRWRTDVGSGVFSTPAVANGRVVVTTDSGAVVALDAGNGSERWRHETGVELGHSSPIVADGSVFVAAGDLLALAPASGEVQWRASEYGGPAGSSPVYAGGLVVVGSQDGSVYAFNADGSLNWSHPTGSAVRATPTVAGQRVVVGADDGTTLLFERATGQVLGTALTGRVGGGAAVANNRAFVATWGGDLVALANVTGRSGGDGSRSVEPVEPGPTPVEPGPTPVEPAPTPITPNGTPVEPGPTPVPPGSGAPGRADDCDAAPAGSEGSASECRPPQVP